jgi:hydroxyethylthiazole kinase-like uncharacterized protein yjeF
MHCHPIVSCTAAVEYEAQLLKDDLAIVSAMEAAGEGVGKAILNDYNQRAPLPRDPHVLILLGKGYNAGDALIAARTILETRPRTTVYLLLAFEKNELKPLLQPLLESLIQLPAVKQIAFDAKEPFTVESIQFLLQSILGKENNFDISIDGLLGVSFRPPLSDAIHKIVQAVNGLTCIKFRAAVDIPTGLQEHNSTLVLHADFTYVVGVPKALLFLENNLKFTGRLRYLNIGFFSEDKTKEVLCSETQLVLPSILNDLAQLRPSNSYKKTFGHLLIVGGSLNTPGALLMASQAALRSGVGLVTIGAPEQLCPNYFNTVPEVMCVGLSMTAEGTIAAKGFNQLDAHLNKATAILIGPGMSLNPETQCALAEWLPIANLPIILDAEALTPLILESVQKRPAQFPPVGITPHHGEFQRLNYPSQLNFEPAELKNFCNRFKVTLLLKGPLTRIVTPSHLWISTFGGPLLARGGSGDLLAGLVAGLIAQSPHAPFLHTFAQAVVWHGKAADMCAKHYGERAVKITDMLNCLSEALRL